MVCRATPVRRTIDPFDGIPPRQLQACAIRLGAKPSIPFSLIGLRMGVSKQRAHDLTRKGLARLRANGYDIADLIARAG